MDTDSGKVRVYTKCKPVWFTGENHSSIPLLNRKWHLFLREIHYMYFINMSFLLTVYDIEKILAFIPVLI